MRVITIIVAIITLVGFYFCILINKLKNVYIYIYMLFCCALFFSFEGGGGGGGFLATSQPIFSECRVPPPPPILGAHQTSNRAIELYPTP